MKDKETRPIEKKELNLRDYMKIVLKRKWLVISIFLIVVVTVTITTLQQERIYRATTTLLIDKEAPTVVNFRQKDVLSLGEGGGSYRDYYQTQFRIIKSLGIMERVYKELELKEDPYYAANNSKFPFKKFYNSVGVEPVLRTRLIKVYVDHNNPVKAAIVANKVSEVYREENLARKLRATKEAVAFLGKEINTFKKKVSGTENSLQTYKEKYELTDLPTEGYLAGLRRMEMEENALKTRLAELNKKYGEKHPNVVEVKTQIGSLGERIHSEKQKTLDLHKALIQFNVLNREADTNKELLSNLLKREKETNLSQSIKTNNIEVIEYAYPSMVPVRPKVRRNIALAMIVGLVCGIGMAFLLNSLDNTLKSPEDIAQQLQLPFLGFVPSVQRKDAKKISDIDLITYAVPKSTVSEAYRSIRTALMFSMPGSPARTITVTSSNPKEGKTTSATNISIVMANAGDKVLLIDADMRKPRLYKSFELDNSVGLSNVLVGSSTIESVIQKTQVPNLFVIPSGPIPPNPSELLHSKKMGEFLNSIGSEFDRVVFDSPPISAVTDSVILGAMSDGVVMVVQSGKTPKEACLFARQKVEDANGRILGVVLNNVALHKDAYYYYYYYRHTYSYYGEEEKSKHKTEVKSKKDALPEEKAQKELV